MLLSTWAALGQRRTSSTVEAVTGTQARRFRDWVTDNARFQLDASGLLKNSVEIPSGIVAAVCDRRIPNGSFGYARSALRAPLQL
ncbi:MAG: hypothetical protein U0V70_12055 [Terriglobia bacterium]